MGTVTSPLPYPVVVDRGALAQVPALLAQHAPSHRVAIIADAAVATRYGTPLLDAVRHSLGPDGALRVTLLPVPSGEASKTRTEWARLTDQLLDWGAGRDTTILALGGGVVGDLAGFVAAALHRGISLVHIPTTLLAMVDSSIGGKCGVDTPAGKNLVGAFHDPSLVVSDVDTLRSLPVQQLRQGLAEMVKHALLDSGDAFDQLTALLPALASPNGAEHSALPALITHSLGVKAQVVAADRRESGRRHTLNVGHTIAHAVEHATAYRVAHGDAVAIGLAVEARMAEALGVADQGLAEAVETALDRAGLPVSLPADSTVDALLEGVRMDKKGRAGTVRFALLQRIGTPVQGPLGDWTTPVPDSAVRKLLVSEKNR
jgi:3-dehydroquinate synthase